MAVNVVTPIADTALYVGEAATTIDVAKAFDLDGVTGTIVKFSNSVAGDIYAELFDAPGPGRSRSTPATAANFLRYVDAGLYTNTIVHRSIDDFVIQAGGFKVTSSGNTIADSIQTFAPVINEPGNTNARGTLAMAKLENQPNSATNQFFFNLADNNDPNDPNSLDKQNGGFTAFARVLGTGMTAVDAIAAVPQFNSGAPFDSIPLVNYTSGDITRDNLVTIPSVTRSQELIYTASSSNPSLAAVTITDAGILSIDPQGTQTGTVTITVRARSVLDPTDFKDDQFTFMVKKVPILVTGADVAPGSQPLVTVINSVTGAIQGAPFLAYESSFRGGIRVAVGDVVGDGTEQIITAPGSGREGQIRVFRQNGTEITSFRSFPYGANYRGGIELAVGDVNGDGTADIVTAASRGAGLVRVFYATPQAAQPIATSPSVAFQAFPARFNGGATVAVGDFGTFASGALTNANAPDGRMEVAVGSGAGMAPTVRVYDLSGTPRVVRTITPLSPSLRGGVSVSTGRFDANAIDDIIVAAGHGGSSRIDVYSGMVLGSPLRLLARQAFAAIGRPNLPVYAAAIPRASDGRMANFAVVQGGGRTEQGVRRISVSTGVETSLKPLSGPLRIAASRLF